MDLIKQFSWRRISQNEIQKIAAVKKEAAKARGEAPSEANSSVNKLWWCLLDEIRTFFEQNPEDFAD